MFNRFTECQKSNYSRETYGNHKCHLDNHENLIILRMRVKALRYTYILFEALDMSLPSMAT